MTSVFSWQNSISLRPASFCTPRPNLPVTPGVSWLPTFAFQSPIMKRTSFWVLVLKGLIDLHRTIHFSFFSVTCWGIDLDCCDIEWFALEMKRSFYSFWDCIQVLHFGLFCWLWWLLHLFSGIPAHIQFSCSLVSNSLWPHEPQHTRPPCPSPIPGVHPNPCPLSWGCHPTVSSSIIPFS